LKGFRTDCQLYQAARATTPIAETRKPLVVVGYAFYGRGGRLVWAARRRFIVFGRAAGVVSGGGEIAGKKALLAADVPPSAYGRAFGLER